MLVNLYLKYQILQTSNKTKKRAISDSLLSYAETTDHPLAVASAISAGSARL